MASINNQLWRALAGFVTLFRNANREQIEDAITGLKQGSNDFGLPSGEREIYKKLLPILRKQLRDFGPRKRNPARKKNPVKRNDKTFLLYTVASDYSQEIVNSDKPFLTMQAAKKRAAQDMGGEKISWSLANIPGGPRRLKRYYGHSKDNELIYTIVAVPNGRKKTPKTNNYYLQDQGTKQFFYRGKPYKNVPPESYSGFSAATSAFQRLIKANNGAWDLSKVRIVSTGDVDLTRKKNPIKKYYQVVKVKGNDVRFLTASSDTGKPRWTLTRGEAIKSIKRNDALHNALVASDYKTVGKGWVLSVIESRMRLADIARRVNEEKLGKA